MYAKLEPANILGKTLDSLNVSIINYTLGTSSPTLGYNIVDTDGNTVTQGTVKLDKETFDSWTTNDDVLLHFVASSLNVNIAEVVKVTKTSAEYLAEDPSLETR